MRTPFCIALTLIAALAGAEDAAPPPLPEHAENFRLLDHEGRSHELFRYADAPAVVLYFHGIGCPIVRQSVPGIKRIRDEFAPKGVLFFMINANPHDTREDVVEDAADFSIDMPILLDTTQNVTRGFGTKRTAETLVIVPKEKWRIAYRGAVDDRFTYGVQRANATKEWLKDALTAVLGGKAVAEPRSETKGCLINFLEEPEVSYSEDIVPILQARCVSCHREGGIGSFAMNSHRKVKGWASMMREVLRTDRMPPWHADPEYGEFVNDLGLTVKEERRLLAWLEAGAPKGDTEADPLESVGPVPGPQWALGKPDLELQLPKPIALPAEGVIDYKYVHVPTGLAEDKWVRAIEVLPTAPAVVHHALIFVIYPKQYRHAQPRAFEGLNGFFASFLPGSVVLPYPEGTGQFLPAGSTFIFQMHYTATGRPETDQTRMALYFHDEKPANSLMIRAASEEAFRIPPHARDYPVRAFYEFPRDAEIWGLSPHMHYRGSRFKYTAITPDGGERILMNIPFYEFDWQPMYNFHEPVRVPAGTRIRCDGAFDNSKLNPKNPNPDRYVFFGRQSFEEMFIGYIQYAVERDDAWFAPRPIDPEEANRPKLTAATLPGTKWRIGPMNILFKENGKVLTTIFGGTWSVEDNVVTIHGSNQTMEATMQDDELFVMGHPLQRVL